MPLTLPSYFLTSLLSPIPHRIPLRTVRLRPLKKEIIQIENPQSNLIPSPLPRLCSQFSAGGTPDSSVDALPLTLGVGWPSRIGAQLRFVQLPCIFDLQKVTIRNCEYSHRIFEFGGHCARPLMFFRQEWITF